MQPKTYVTVVRGSIRWVCHYCHAAIDGPGVAAVRLEDVRARQDAPGEAPRARWYVCHEEHEVLVLEDRHYASGRHRTAREVQEAIARDQGGDALHRINLNELRTVLDVRFVTGNVVRRNGWLADTDWLAVVAGPVGVTEHHAGERAAAAVP